MPPRPPLDELLELYRALILAQGVTTANGNVGGTTFVDANLIGAVGIVNATAVIFPGQPLLGQVRDTTVFNAATGEVTVSAAFSAQVLAGTPYVILAAPPTVAEVAAIAANLLLLMADVGDASASTLGSLYAILGNPPALQTFLAMIGYEGATALAAKLTAARALLLDRIALLAAGGAGELTVVRVQYLDALAAAVHVPEVTEAVGNLNYNEASAVEQTLLTLAIAARSRIGSFWFNMINVTRIATIRLYHQTNGGIYTQFAQYSFNPALDSDGVLVDGFTAYRNVQVSFQCDGLGAAVVVPYAIV